MRYGRISEVSITDQYTVYDDIGDIEEDIDGYYKIVKGNILGVDATFYILSKMISFRSDDIIVSEDLGAFPFNIIKWRHLYDMDILIRTERVSGGVDSGKNTNMSTTLVADVSIYNPPNHFIKRLHLPKPSLVHPSGEVEILKGLGDSARIMEIRSGYYGFYGNNSPKIFRGKITEMSFVRDTAESLLELKSSSSTENLHFVRPRVFSGFLRDVIEEIVLSAGATLGRVITEFGDVPGEPENIIVPPITIETNTKLIDACRKIVRAVNKKYNLRPPLEVFNTSGAINIVPANWSYYTGISLTHRTGLTEIRRNEEVSSELHDGFDEPEWTIECLFIPEIEYKNVVKCTVSDGAEPMFFVVEKFRHDIPHNDVATTTLFCEKLDVENFRFDEENYTIYSVNPFLSPETGYDVYSLGAG